VVRDWSMGVRRALRVNEYLMSIRDMRGIWAQLGLFTGQFNLFVE
jgi:hypothetical protein